MIILTPLERKFLEFPGSWNLPLSKGAAMVGIPTGSFSATRHRLRTKGVLRMDADGGLVMAVADAKFIVNPRHPSILKIQTNSTVIFMTPSEKSVAQRVCEWRHLSNEMASKLLDMPVGTFTSCRYRLHSKGVFVKAANGMFELADGQFEADGFRKIGYASRKKTSRTDVDALRKTPTRRRQMSIEPEEHFEPIVETGVNALISGHTPVDVPGLGDAAVKRIIARLGVNSIEAAADIVDALCANGTITADLLIRVKRRFDLLRQLRELDA
jgi:hypothetical protein